RITTACRLGTVSPLIRGTDPHEPSRLPPRPGPQGLAPATPIPFPFPGSHWDMLEPPLTATASEQQERAEAADGARAARTREGLLYGLAAYGWWGLVPVYFKAVADLPAVEILAQRIVWSLFFLAALLGW